MRLLCLQGRRPLNTYEETGVLVDSWLGFPGQDCALDEQSHDFVGEIGTDPSLQNDP